MSVPDCQIEEQDERICEDHNELRPCYACYADEVDRWHDERREREE